MIRGVQILITTACDRRCPDCCQQIPRKAPGEHDAWENFERAARYLSGLPLTVCGGEATIHPEFDRIARNFRALFEAPYMEISTNGYGVIAHGAVMGSFDKIRITDYPEPATRNAIAWVQTHLPGRLQLDPPGHLPLNRPGSGLECFRTSWPIHFAGRLWPCCVGTGFENAASIELCDDWRQRVAAVPLPCDRCVFSGHES